MAVLGADVLHLVDGTALGAALDGAVAGGGEPDDNVRVGRVAGAAKVLLVTEGLDGDRVVERACVLLSVLLVQVMSDQNRVSSRPMHSSHCFKLHILLPKQIHSSILFPPGLYVPFLLASRGLRSKMSTPCIFPRISRRSRPVACSRSVGMVPGLAPSGRRSASEVISAAREKLSVTVSSHCRAIAQRLAISANGISSRPMAQRRLFRRYSGGICLRSKGLTCLETSPGLGSPWVPLSTGESQRSQPHVSKTPYHTNTASRTPRSPLLSISCL